MLFNKQQKKFEFLHLLYCHYWVPVAKKHICDPIFKNESLQRSPYQIEKYSKYF